MTLNDTNIPPNCSILAEALLAAPADAFEQCDKMYRAYFRSTAMPACIWLSGNFGYSETDFELLFGVAYNPDILVVELCNFKGEGEGWATFDKASTLPVWKSKTASATFFRL